MTECNRQFGHYCSTCSNQVCRNANISKLE